jgi:hypothetical protein
VFRSRDQMVRVIAWMIVIALILGVVAAILPAVL